MFTQTLLDDEAPALAPPPARPGLGLIGAGAFGTFCIAHLAPHFRLRLTDPRPDLPALAARHGVEAADLAAAAAEPVVVLAVPQPRLEAVARAIAPHLAPGSLVIDVCSIKQKPLATLLEHLPDHVDVVGTHPLFGPRSGAGGIAGLRVAVCAGRGRSTGRVARFLERKLGLAVLSTTAAEHDRQMAYVQGLTHLLARIVLAMDVPELAQTTTAFEHLTRMVEVVRSDSDELFRTITAENPFVDEVKARLLEATRALATPLSPG